MAPTRDDVLAQALERAQQGDPIRMSVRDFIAMWQAKGRGPRVVERIRSDLAEVGLATRPDFRAWGLDSVVRLVVAPPAVPEPATPDLDQEESGPESLRLQVGNLASASAGIVSVTPSHDIAAATTLMILHDYSQLAVLEGERSLKGAITWETLGRGHLRGRPARVSDVTMASESVVYDADLLSLVPRIVEAGFVFVRGVDNKITGIVTTADLSKEFVDLARPFFLLGEIERRFRRLVQACFAPKELAEAVDRADEREVESAADLTLGELERLVQRPEHWQRLRLSVARNEFLAAIARVRDVRNDVMHFSPDPPGEEELESLRGFLRLLRHLAR